MKAMCLEGLARLKGNEAPLMRADLLCAVVSVWV
jgi:hypothetical protein